MKKLYAVSLLTLLLFSCGGGETSSESSSASSASNPQSSSMESSSRETSSSSSSEVSSSSEASSLNSESSSSEEAGSSSESSYSSEDSSSSLDSSISEWSGSLTIDAGDIPSTTSGQYLIEETFTVDEYSFLANYVQRGSGKFSEDYIQMRKFDEVDASYLQSKSVLGGTITIAVNRNYNSYGQIDMTACPTVYCSSSPDEKGEAIEMEAAAANDETTDFYLYQGKGDGYFTIANETSYALYLNYISWNN